MSKNLEQVLRKIKQADKVLDVGGWLAPLARADVVIDCLPYETRGQQGVLGDGPEKFTKDSWVIYDICNNKPWPFKDKEFDFVFCSHVLEDSKDPAWICSEMIRVGKRGYIETPSRTIESKKGIGGSWKMHKNITGYYFHRWFVEVKNGELIFTPKSPLIQVLNKFQIKGKITNPITDFFWKNDFKYQERIYLREKEILDDLLRFKIAVNPLVNRKRLEEYVGSLLDLSLFTKFKKSLQSRIRKILKIDRATLIFLKYKKLKYRNKIIKFLVRNKAEKNKIDFNQISDYPVSIGLALSLACTAKCIFCPSDRGLHIPTKFMSKDLMIKILNDTKANNFKGQFSLSENGDALLNPDFLEIFKMIRKAHPYNHLVLFTNMSQMTKELSYLILSLGLDEIHFNIDGATPETYSYVKGLDYEEVKRNIFDFLENRRQLHSGCQVVLQVLSANRYEKSIDKKPKYHDDTLEVLKFWQNYLRDSDEMKVSYIYNWADHKKLNQKNRCFYFPRILEELLITTDGRCYLCCLDSNAGLVFGDINKNFIREIWQGEKRKKMLELLATGKITEIGYPCIYCQEEKL